MNLLRLRLVFSAVVGLFAFASMLTGAIYVMPAAVTYMATMITATALRVFVYTFAASANIPAMLSTLTIVLSAVGAVLLGRRFSVFKGIWTFVQLHNMRDRNGDALGVLAKMQDATVNIVPVATKMAKAVKVAKEYTYFDSEGRPALNQPSVKDRAGFAWKNFTETGGANDLLKFGAQIFAFSVAVGWGYRSYWVNKKRDAKRKLEGRPDTGKQKSRIFKAFEQVWGVLAIAGIVGVGMEFLKNTSIATNVLHIISKLFDIFGGSDAAREDKKVALEEARVHADVAKNRAIADKVLIETEHLKHEIEVKREIVDINLHKAQIEFDKVLYDQLIAQINLGEDIDIVSHAANFRSAAYIELWKNKVRQWKIASDKPNPADRKPIAFNSAGLQQPELPPGGSVTLPEVSEKALQDKNKLHTVQIEPIEPRVKNTNVPHEMDEAVQKLQTVAKEIKSSEELEVQLSKLTPTEDDEDDTLGWLARCAGPIVSIRQWLKDNCYKLMVDLPVSVLGMALLIGAGVTIGYFMAQMRDRQKEEKKPEGLVDVMTTVHTSSIVTTSVTGDVKDLQQMKNLKPEGASVSVGPEVKAVGTEKVQPPPVVDDGWSTCVVDPVTYNKPLPPNPPRKTKIEEVVDRAADNKVEGADRICEKVDGPKEGCIHTANCPAVKLGLVKTHWAKSCGVDCLNKQCTHFKECPNEFFVDYEDKCIRLTKNIPEGKKLHWAWYDNGKGVDKEFTQQERMDQEIEDRENPWDRDVGESAEEQFQIVKGKGRKKPQVNSDASSFKPKGKSWADMVEEEAEEEENRRRKGRKPEGNNAAQDAKKLDDHIDPELLKEYSRVRHDFNSVKAPTGKQSELAAKTTEILNEFESSKNKKTGLSNETKAPQVPRSAAHAQHMIKFMRKRLDAAVTKAEQILKKEAKQKKKVPEGRVSPHLAADNKVFDSQFNIYLVRGKQFKDAARMQVQLKDLIEIGTASAWAVKGGSANLTNTHLIDGEIIGKKLGYWYSEHASDPKQNVPYDCVVLAKYDSSGSSSFAPYIVHMSKWTKMQGYDVAFLPNARLKCLKLTVDIAKVMKTQHGYVSRCHMGKFGSTPYNSISFAPGNDTEFIHNANTQGGDSGSLLVDDSGEAFAMHYATNEDRGLNYAYNLRAILDKIDLTNLKEAPLN